MEILDAVAQGEHKMISSDILLWEIDKIPDAYRKAEIRKILTLAETSISLDSEITARAEFLTTLGFRSFDALHVATAEQANAKCFLTTDDKLLKLAAKNEESIKISVMNPVQWIWNQMT
jgi:predicted nucleic acid-binding protein